jgi:hypothetical protein
MTMQPYSQMDGMGYTDPNALPKKPGWLAGIWQQYFGQPTNNVTGVVANQGIGTALLTSTSGTVLAGSTNTIYVPNTLVTANTIVMLTAANLVSAGTFAGDTTALRGMEVWIESVTATYGFVIGYSPKANMSHDWSCWYELKN